MGNLFHKTGPLWNRFSVPDLIRLNAMYGFIIFPPVPAQEKERSPSSW